jgi:hypothetical protein
MCLGWRRGGKLYGDVRLYVRNAHHDVLRLDVRMYKVTFFVKILQAEKDLPGDTLYDARRDTFPTVFLDEGEDVCAEGLKGDAYMGCRGDCVGERIEEGDDMGPPGMRGGGICDLS